MVVRHHLRRGLTSSAVARLLVLVSALSALPADAAIRPVVFENGIPTAASVIEEPVRGQALWDSDMVLNTSRVNVLALAHFCPYICLWLPEFINNTGIDVTVHCWDGSREAFGAGLVQVAPDLTAEQSWKLCEPFGGNIYILPKPGFMEAKADATRAFLGGMDIIFQEFGIVAPEKSSWCCEDDWSAQPSDIMLDLTPFLASSTFDWLTVLPAVRDVSATSGAAAVALPMDLDAYTLFHQVFYRNTIQDIYIYVYIYIDIYIYI